MSKARKFRGRDAKTRNPTGINLEQLREAEAEIEKIKTDGDLKLDENINKSITNKDLNEEYNQAAAGLHERIPSSNDTDDNDPVSSVTTNHVAKPPRNVPKRSISRAPEQPEPKPPARIVPSSDSEEDDLPLHDMNEGDLQQQVYDLEDRIDDLEMENKKLRAQIELKDLEIERLQKEARKAERQRARATGTRTRTTRAKETDL
ncbi:Oidioi.mRNA.OKI2018_I69.chr1.g2316.t1.cds [Oikopleura dioica]|uniref:Oidioi.mRNA.OKI2018_I69.chr1.g2316.t1.cds n=1 Tax=Oikopleura dioica TaxID=34765 RepID=A0ABN7SQR2_OIKDI|nr:Oidioi.mRNA.OKI2018_I69.chr1.g2316.t1.cds [Oikopleura dioica]